MTRSKIEQPTSRGIEPWDSRAVERTLRLLASHASNFSDRSGREGTLRLLWDVLNRRGLTSEVIEDPDTAPLLVSGRGLTLIVVHLDDIRRTAQSHVDQPATLIGDRAFGPGICRKAAVLAAVGLMAQCDNAADRFTLLIETDRYSGSLAVERWFENAADDRKIGRAFCEVADLPVPSPALFRGAAGSLLIEISLTNNQHSIDGQFSEMDSDTGHRLAQAVSALKSSEGEILVPGFYDDTVTTEPSEMAALQGIVPYVAEQMQRDHGPSPHAISANHLTLGTFLAPSLAITSIEVKDHRPWLPESGRAAIDIRVMPGQNASALADKTITFLRDRLPDATISLAQIRPSALGELPEWASSEPSIRVLPVAPGVSPAGLIEARGIPVTGFSTVWIDPSAEDEYVEIAAIADGTTFLKSLGKSSSWPPSESVTPI